MSDAPLGRSPSPSQGLLRASKVLKHGLRGGHLLKSSRLQTGLTQKLGMCLDALPNEERVKQMLNCLAELRSASPFPEVNNS